MHGYARRNSVEGLPRDTACRAAGQIGESGPSRSTDVRKGSDNGTIMVALNVAFICSADRTAIGTADGRQTRPHMLDMPTTARLRECDESRCTRCSERHSAQIDAAARAKQPSGRAVPQRWVEGAELLRGYVSGFARSMRRARAAAFRPSQFPGFVVSRSSFGRTSCCPEKPVGEVFFIRCV